MNLCLREIILVSLVYRKKLVRPAGGFAGSSRLKTLVVKATTLETTARVTITAASSLSFLVANKGLSLQEENYQIRAPFFTYWTSSNP